MCGRGELGQEGGKGARCPASEGFHGHSKLSGSPPNMRARQLVTMGWER